MKYPLLLCVAVGLLHFKEAFAAQCACATGNVNVRDGVGTSHHILHVLLIHHCLPYKGHKRTNSDGTPWANVNYQGKDGWVSTKLVHITTKTSCSGTSTSGSGSGSGTHTGGGAHSANSLQLAGCPHIIPRHEWHARAPKNRIPHLAHVPKYMFIHHGASAGCHTKVDCIQKAREYQNYHIDSRGWPDIGYSFLVGGDGHVYEARGWNEVGAHTLGYNDVGLAICFIGNFMDHVPNNASLHAARQLIKCAHDHHKITSSYTLRGHRDMAETACPGTKLYNIIKHWPHY